MHGHTWKIGHHRKEVTIFGSKRSDMVPGGTEHAAEWLQSVRRYLLAMRWAFESSKSSKRVKRYAISCVCHMCLGGACTLHDTTHSASYYSYYTVMHTHRVVNMFFMNYTSTILCMDHGYIHECHHRKLMQLRHSHRHMWHTHDMAYLFTRLMDLDDSKAHLIAIRYLRTDCNHSAASAVPPGTISLRLLSNMVTSWICYSGLIHLG